MKAVNKVSRYLELSISPKGAIDMRRKDEEEEEEEVG